MWLRLSLFFGALVCLFSWTGYATKLQAALDSGFAFDTNPYSLRLANIQGFGSFALRALPSLEFEGEGRVARIFVSARADGAFVFGTEQDARVMLTSGEFIAKSELNPSGLVAMLMDGTIATSRQVEMLFLDSLTQVTSGFRFGIQMKPSLGSIRIQLNAEAKTQSYFDVSQPTSGKYAGNPDELSNEGYYGSLQIAWDFQDNKVLFADAKYGLWRGREESKHVAVNPLWINLGFASEITPTVKGRLSAGFANSYIRLLRTGTILDGASAAFSVLGEVDWDLSPEARLSFGLSRELSPTPIFLEHYRNAVVINYDQKWMGRLRTLFAPYFVFYEYGKPLAPDNAGRLAGNHRSDVVLGMKEEVAYFFEDWLGVGISHQGWFRWSNAADMQVFTLNGKLADLDGNFHSYTNGHEVLVFGRLTY